MFRESSLGYKYLLPGTNNQGTLIKEACEDLVNPSQLWAYFFCQANDLQQVVQISWLRPRLQGVQRVETCMKSGLCS